jgi:RND superfamily putative drug exporter
MELGHIGPGEQPTSYSERRAYDEIAEAFGPGTDVRMTVVVKLAPRTSASEAKRISARSRMALKAPPTSPRPVRSNRPLTAAR